MTHFPMEWKRRAHRMCLPRGARVHMIRRMPVGWIEQVGRNTNNNLAAFGDFCVFAARTFRWLFTGWFRWKDIRTLFPLMYEVGVRSVPVIAVTGAFIGMVMAVETHTQFKSIGQEERIGSIISLSVVKQIG